MTEHSPITPPPELVQQWEQDWHHSKVKHVELMPYIAVQAAQWGADQELEACCEWLQDPDLNVDTYKLRATRRPKPPSLKEQALSLVEQHEDGWRPSPKDWDTIRRALEQLDD